jgi:hypothetical protein
MMILPKTAAVEANCLAIPGTVAIVETVYLIKIFKRPDEINN